MKLSDVTDEMRKRYRATIGSYDAVTLTFEDAEAVKILAGYVAVTETPCIPWPQSPNVAVLVDAMQRCEDGIC